MPMRGMRGATTTPADEPEAILSATRALLAALVEANPGLEPVDVASVLFTVTADLQSAYPALAARQIGWEMVPLMCAQEIPVPGSLARCIRVLIHWNTDRRQQDIRPVYLGEAASLRPELQRSKVRSTDWEP